MTSPETHDNWDRHLLCLRRIRSPQHGWCLLSEGHAGSCAGRLSAVPEAEDLGPGAAKRRRF